MDAINRKINFEDKEWKKSNDVDAFIEITDLNMLLKVNKEKITLFDAMTKMSILEVYAEFDWGTI